MVNERKIKIVEKLCQCFTDYKQVAIVSLDNVSTNQLHNARKILTEGTHKGDMIIGKNTLIKKALKFMTEEPNPSDENYEHHKKWTQKPELKVIEQHIKDNVGLIFSEEEYSELKTKIEAEKISMPARTGVEAPCTVTIPEGPTGVEVGKIDLFHKLNISCKTVKSAIEVVKPVTIIKKGEKVGEGATQMCKLLNIVPFEYALEFKFVYLDGVILDQDALNMDLDELVEELEGGIGLLKAVSVGAGLPNALSVPVMLQSAFQSCVAFALGTGTTFKQLEDLKTSSANAGPAQVTTTATAAKVEEKAAAVEEEEEEDEDLDMCDLFD